MKSGIIYISLILSIALSSCVSEFNAVLPPQENNLLVVEGDIIGDTVVIFSLNKSYSMDEPITTLYPEIWATLTVIDSNGGESSPAQYIGQGKYQLTIGKLDENLLYGLRIEYDGNTYLSELSKPRITPEIDDIKAMQPIERGDVHFYVSTHDKEDGARYFMWNYVEDWEITANYYADIFFNPLTQQFYRPDYNPVYYCWKSNRRNSTLLGTSEALTQNRIIDHEFAAHKSTDDRFSLLYSMLLSQKAISKSAYEYYLNKRKINEEMGGLFSPQPSDFYGNITCQTDPSKRAVGYVEVIKNVSRKRIFVDASTISRQNIYSGCEIITADSIATLMKDYEFSYLDVYNKLMLRPLTEGMFSSPESWTSVWCADCTVSGTKNKPDFWPNNHQ